MDKPRRRLGAGSRQDHPSHAAVNRRLFVAGRAEPPVARGQIRRAPDQTRIPFFTVEAVVEAPMGCAPHECYGMYEPFFTQLDAYAERTSKDPVKGCKEYLEEFYYGPKSWAEAVKRAPMWLMMPT